MKKEDNEKLSKVDISVKYICNQLTDPFFVSDANFNIIYANDSFKKLIGKKPIGKKCYNLIHELDKFVKGGAYETAVKTKKAAIIELFEPRLKKWLMIVATPVPKKGKLIVCTQHIKDITERKGKEKGIQMLSSMVKQTTEGAAVADLKGNLLFCNEAWSRMHGYKSPEELFGKSLAIFHNKEQLEKEVKPFNKKVIALGAFSGEVGHITKDGKPFPTLMATSLLKDEQGKPYAIAGIAMDITEQKKAEEELKQSEERFSNIFNYSPESFILVNNRRIIIDINEAVVKTLGYSKKSIIGKNILSLHFKTEFSKCIKSMDMALSGKLASCDCQYVDSNKKLVFADSLLSPIEISGERHILISFRDLTEQKKAEEELKQSKERYKSLYETSADAIMTLEPPSWKFTSGNPSAVKMFRAKDEKQFISLGPWEVSPEKQPDGRLSSEKAKAMIMKAMKEGSNFFEWTHKRYKGEDFPATVLLTRMAIEGKTFLQATVRDITESKKAEEEMKLHNEILKNLSEGIYLIGLDDYIIKYSNRVFERIFGYGPGELVGKEVSIVNAPLPEKTPTQVRDDIVASLKKQKEWHGEVQNIRKDGTRFWCYANVSLFEHPAYGKVMLAVHSDITERKKAEILTKENEEKYRNLFENSPIIKAVLDEKWNLLDLNKKAEDITGYKKEELVGRNVAQMPIFSKKAIEIMHGNFVRRLKGEDVKPYEIEFNDRKGNRHYGTLYGSMMHSASENRNYALIVITEETEKIKMQKDIAAHVRELEVFKEFAVNRELKMIELKDRIKKLEQKAMRE